MPTFQQYIYITFECDSKKLIGHKITVKLLTFCR